MRTHAWWTASVLTLLGVHSDAVAQVAAALRAMEASMGSDMLPHEPSPSRMPAIALPSLPGVTPAAAPTVEEIGDVDSFKRSLR